MGSRTESYFRFIKQSQKYGILGSPRRAPVRHLWLSHTGIDCVQALSLLPYMPIGGALSYANGCAERTVGMGRNVYHVCAQAVAAGGVVQNPSGGAPPKKKGVRRRKGVSVFYVPWWVLLACLVASAVATYLVLRRTQPGHSAWALFP